MAEGHNSTCVARDKRLARRLLFVGWDGADAHTLRKLLATGQLPHLNSLVASGATLELTIPRPRFCQSAWTSLATGKRPHKHGVLHTFCRVGEGSNIRPISRHDRKCDALWNVLSQSGLHAHAIGWPVTHPADPVSGICVSDLFAASRGSSRDSFSGSSVMPPEAAQVFIERSVAPHQVEELTLGQLLPSHARGSRAHVQIDAACREVLAETATRFRAIRWCLDTQPWDFAACVFPGIRRCHELANWMRGFSPVTAELCDSLIVGCYEHHDLLLGQLLSQIEDNTHVIVVSPNQIASALTSESHGANDSPAADSVARSSGLAVVYGPEVCQQAQILSRSLLDIAPTILSMFGLPYGADMDGRPLGGLFTGGLVVETIATWDSPTLRESLQSNAELTAGAEVTADDRDRNRETQHLTDLGYVDPIDLAASEAAHHCERTTILNRAISLMDAGLFDQAAVIFGDLVKEYQDWPDCRSLLAETFYRAGRYHEAREQIDWLTCHGNESPHLYLLSATIGIAERQLDRALEEASCARRGTAHPAELPSLAGSIYLRKRDFVAAEKAFRQAIEANSQTSAALVGMASVKLHWKEYEEAAVFALDALEKDMRLANAHYNLALALYFLDKPQESLQALTSWATLQPRVAAPYWWMARVYRQLLHDSRQAESCLQQGKQVIRRRRESLATAQEAGTSTRSSGP